MALKTKTTFKVFFCALCVCVGGIELSCDKADPVQPSNLTCICKHMSSDRGIQWYKNNIYMTDCYLKTETCLGYSESTSVNSVAKEYKFSKNFYNYLSCDVYTCRDLHQPEVTVSQRIAVQDTTLISTLNVTEPATNHTSGFIGIVTGCIYGASSEEKNLDIQWLVVMGSEEKSFQPVNTTIKTHNGSCKLCDGDKATQFVIGFHHNEEMGCQANEAKFRIILTHKRTSSALNITTRNFYCVSEQNADGSTSRRSTNWIILIVFFLVLLLQYIALMLMYLHRRRMTTYPGRNPSNTGHFDTGIEMRDSIPTGSLQVKLLLLAYVPVLGIIGVIAYIYTCCSCTNTEGTEGTLSGVSEGSAEKEQMLLTEVNQKLQNNQFKSNIAFSRCV